MAKPLVIISHPEDTKLKDMFLEYLRAALQDDYSSQVWDVEGEISHRDREEEIEDAINQAQIATLLITTKLLIHPFIRHRIIPKLQQGNELGQLKVFPIICKPCPWQVIEELTGLSERPKGRAVWQHDFQDQDAAIFLTNIVQELRSILKKESFSVSEANYSEISASTQQGLQKPLLYPAPTSGFVNRDNEVIQIRHYLETGQVVTLYGPSGIGKSALANQVAYIIRKDTSSQMFPDGVIHFDFSTPEETNHLLEDIARYLNEDLSPNARSAAKRALARHRVLLLLDGVEITNQIHSFNLESLLKIRSSGCGMLITSQTHRGIDSRKLPIRPLSIKEAVKVLNNYAGNRNNNELAAWQICKLVGGLPSAVCTIGKNIADEENISDYLNRLQKDPLGVLPDISQSIEDNLCQVSEIARNLLGVIGRLAKTPFRRKLLGVATGLPISEVQNGLKELINYGLLYHPPNEEYYEIGHTLVHTYANQRLEPSKEIIERLAKHYLGWINQQKFLGARGRELLNFECPHIIISVLRECVSRNICWENVYFLVEAIDEHLDRQGHWTKRIIALEFGLKAVRTLKLNCEADFLGKLGVTFYNFGQLSWALECHKRALTLSRKNSGLTPESVHQSNLGNTYRALGEFDIAEGHLTQARIKSQEGMDRYGESICSAYIGSLYFDKKLVKKAEYYFKHALNLARERRDPQTIIMCLNKLGEMYQTEKELNKAEECFRWAVLISQRFGNLYSETISLFSLGSLYQDSGQQDKAEKFLLQAQERLEKVESQLDNNSTLDNLEREYPPLQRINVHSQLEIFFGNRINQIEKSSRSLAKIDKDQRLSL